MKSNIFLAIIVICIFTACEPPVVFNEPQPKDEKDLQTLPAKICGTYKNKNGDNLLVINSNSIESKCNYEFQLSKNELNDTNSFELNGNKLFDKRNNIYINVQFRNDSVYGKWFEQYNVFRLNENNVVRKYKGHYFLNTKNDYGYVVTILTINGNELSYKEISDTTALGSLTENNQLTTISDTSNNVSAYIISPEKRDLKKFIKSESLHFNETVFIKINNE